MMKQLESIWFFSIFPSCFPVLTCVEESSTTEEPDLQENLIIGSKNVMLAPPRSPLMLNTNATASTTPKEMHAFSNKTNVEQLALESETAEKYANGQPHVYKIERIPPNPFETLLASSSDATSAKPARMRWTTELHEHFVEAVNQLGGCENATPNGILNLMRVEGLTIEHTESHLQELLSPPQKYLTARGRYESSLGEKSSQMEETPSLGATIYDIDINEALEIQMEVQKQLHEHLEMQRKLQMRIEEQGKHLKRMIEQQQHATVDQSRASSVSSNNFDDCIEERTNQTRDNDEHDAMLQN